MGRTMGDEEDLRTTARRWRAIAEAVPSTALVVDDEDRIQLVNHALPGMADADVNGQSVYDLVDECSRPALGHALEQARATGARATIEVRGAAPRGDAWYEMSLRSLDEDGVLVVAKDVSKRRQAEDASRVAERCWNVLAKSLPDIIALLDREGRLLSINRTSPDGRALIGEHAHSFLAEESVAEYREKLASVLSSRTMARFESRNRDAVGDVGVWFETILVPLVDDGEDEVERVLAVARDITERKRNEQAIRASELRWRMLVDNLPDVVLVLDRDRRILSARLPGGAAEISVVGRLADTFLDDTMLTEFHGHFAKALETKSTVRYEIRSSVGTGVPRWYDSILVPLDNGGEIDRLMLVTRDVTANRAMLAALAEKERLASIGMVAASVAHEIMNPLMYVLANLEHALGQRHADAASWSRSLADAREGAKRMQQIVWDLRSLGRTGKADLFYVDPRSVLESALRLSGPEVGRTANIALDLEEVPGVIANESLLCQVFINLLVNAAQAMAGMPRENREIRVSTRYDEPTSHVAVEITDRGEGVPSFLHARIFEPLFTTKRVGTGLGLSISRDIVTRMGGRIDLTSAEGRGATFTVWLPATRNEGAVSTSP